MNTLLSEKKQRIYEEWQKFLRGGEVDPSIVRDFVYRSWRRCREYHIDPVRQIQKVVDEKALHEELEKNRVLIESARNIMGKVFSKIASSSSYMSLASKNGVILYTLPGETKVIEPGMRSREEFIGTAGISTCLEEKQTIEIFGAEHYCTENHNLVCSATPITDFRGDFLGVLGITSLCETFHPHTSGMLEAASYAISEQLGLREVLGEQNALFEMLDDGVITLDNQQTVRFLNNNAMNMLGFIEKPTGRRLTDFIHFSKDIRNMIESCKSFHDLDTTLILQEKNQSISCVLSATVNQSTHGMVLTLREAARMREYVTRATGSNALFCFDDIYGQSPLIKEVIKKAQRIADTDTTVMLFGESGTGKELFAQSLHNASSRRNKPFVVVNCGALPRELIQSELFGYVEGSFTGASRSGKQGKFELADGGTVFLDEIGEMPLDVQVNLLRLLQNREVVRIGDKRTRIVNIRIIAATNRNLYHAVQEKTFRADLYYRLNVFPLHIPALRERDDDVCILAQKFLEKFSKVSKHNIHGISKDAMNVLRSYTWPGNVRELENMMERLAYMAYDNEVSVNDLTECMTKYPTEKGEFNVHLKKVDEKKLIEDALKLNHGAIKETLKTLQMNRSTFYYKLKQYGIRARDYRYTSGMATSEKGIQPNLLGTLEQEDVRLLIEFARHLRAFSGEKRG
ncbi:MAG: sigma 54-interacting transcriptional regulator [Desulfovibrionaceae bacterium]|nr:sigma 54-interacting transcriptional regulator [Desulfovibrionaceae bacterium]